jgi:hypothetical protein
MLILAPAPCSAGLKGDSRDLSCLLVRKATVCNNGHTPTACSDSSMHLEHSHARVDGHPLVTPQQQQQDEEKEEE